MVFEALWTILNNTGTISTLEGEIRSLIGIWKNNNDIKKEEKKFFKELHIDDDSVKKVSDQIKESNIPDEMLEKRGEIFAELRSKFTEQFFTDHDDLKDDDELIKDVINSYFDALEEKLFALFSPGEKTIVNILTEQGKALSKINQNFEDNKAPEDMPAPSFDIYLYFLADDLLFRLDKEKTQINIIKWLDIIKNNGSINVHEDYSGDLREYIETQDPNSPQTIYICQFLEGIERKKQQLARMLLFVLNNLTYYRNSIVSWEALIEGCVDFVFNPSSRTESDKKVTVCINSGDKFYFKVMIPESDYNNIYEHDERIKIAYFIYLNEIKQYFTTDYLMEKYLFPAFLYEFVSRAEKPTIPESCYDFTLWFISLD